MTFVASFPPSLRSGTNDTTRATNKLYALQESCDCPIFTWSNRLVHGLGKWHAKIWTGEFCPGIAFTICTNQFHLPKNDREGLKRPKTGLKDGFEEMEHEFPFGIFRPEKHDHLFRCSVTPGNLPMERPKCHVPFSFQTDFPETFCK